MRLEEHFDGFARRDWQRTTTGTVRVAMIALGWWTREFAIPATEAADLCETTVVVSGSADKAGAVAAEHGVEHALTYDEFHDGAAADAYDAVYVCTPNALHLEYVETAADLGKAVLCEKPMEASVERAEELVAACEDAGVPLMVAYRMQTEPAVRRMRELVREGFVGDPVQVHGHMSQPLLEIIADPDQWRLDPDLAGPGASVTDLGVYPINTSRFVLDADPAAVTATTHSGGGAFADVPDERAAFTVEFPDGVQAACTVSQNAHHTGHLEVVGATGRLRLEPAFFGWDGRALTVARGDTEATVDFETPDQMTEEFDYFADRVLAGDDPHPDGRHGLVDMRAVEAVYEAAESGERVRI